eukprot:302077-Rhodomonas_salina.1
MALRSRANHALKNLSVSLTASRTLMRTHVPFAASPVRSITTNPAQSGMTFIRHAATTTKFHGFLPNAASSHRHLSTEADSAALEESPPELRVQVLDAALNHVHQWGWTAQAIAAGAKDLGLSAYSHGLFPRCYHQHSSEPNIMSDKLDALVGVRSSWWSTFSRRARKNGFKSSPRSTPRYALHLNFPLLCISLALFFPSLPPSKSSARRSLLTFLPFPSIHSHHCPSSPISRPLCVGAGANHAREALGSSAPAPLQAGR